MTQELRNKIYGVVSGIVTIAVVVGVINQGTSDEALSLSNSILDLGAQVLALAGLVTAFVKSLPSRTTTIDLPKAEVDSVNTSSGAVVAVVGKNTDVVS